jgi:hypothetical protein
MNELLNQLPLEGFGNRGSSQSRKAPTLRVCSNTFPGPVKSITNPSPPKIVDFNPPIVRTLKPIFSEKSHQMARIHREGFAGGQIDFVDRAVTGKDQSSASRASQHD